MDLLTKLVIDAAEIRVAPNNKTPEGIQVLDVLIKSHSGQISSMEQVLMNYDAAAPVKREVDLFNYLKAQTIERWNDNECSGGIIKVIKKLDSYQEDIPRPEDPEKNFDTSASMKKVQQWKDDFSKPKTLITESTRKPLIGKASSDISSIKSILNRPFEPLSSKKVVPKTAPKAPVPATNSHLPPDSIRYIEMIKAIHKGMYKFKVAPAVEPEFQNNPAPKQESREALQDLKDSNHSFDDLRSESSWNKLPPSQAPDTTLKFIKASRSQEAKPKTKSMFEVQERLKQQAFKPLKEEPPKSRPLIFIPAGANYDDSFLRSNPMKPSKKLIPTSISSSHKSNKSFQDSIPEMKVPVQLKTINSTNSYEKAARNEAW